MRTDMHGYRNNASTGVLLLVENNAYPADFRVRREAGALRDAGCRVAVIAPRDPGQPWTECLDGVSVYRFPAPPGGRGVLGYAFEFGYATLAMLLLTAWVAIRHRVDVIHAANPPDTLCLIGAVFKPFGKRFVFDHHDLAPETYLSRFALPRADLVYRVLRALERASYALADVVIATNESYRRLAISRGGKRPDRVFVVRNGPPLSYQPLEPDPELVGRARHLIGYIGTIGPQDGVDHWLRAIHEMVFSQGRRDFLAVVIGSGDALPAARALAEALQIEAYVLFTGRLGEFEARRCLSAVAVCVQPDPLSPLNDKSTMNKLMEYMALGKPTVAFDLAETRCSAGEAALYVRPNDERAFAERVSWLLDHPEECARMGEIGRRRVAEGLAWEYSVPHLLRAYGEGLGLGRRRGGFGFSAGLESGDAGETG
jgi:glycosyltransferase involved in cell wall biosynthesis